MVLTEHPVSKQVGVYNPKSGNEEWGNMHCSVPTNRLFLVPGKSSASRLRLAAMATRDFSFWIDRGGTFTDVMAQVSAA